MGAHILVPKGIQYCTVDPADYQKSVSCPAYGSSHTTGTVTETFDAEGDVLTSTDATGAIYDQLLLLRVDSLRVCPFGTVDR